MVLRSAIRSSTARSASRGDWGSTSTVSLQKSRIDVRANEITNASSCSLMSNAVFPRRRSDQAVGEIAPGVACSWLTGLPSTALGLACSSCAALVIAAGAPMIDVGAQQHRRLAMFHDLPWSRGQRSRRHPGGITRRTRTPLGASIARSQRAGRFGCSLHAADRQLGRPSVATARSSLRSRPSVALLRRFRLRRPG